MVVAVTCPCCGLTEEPVVTWVTADTESDPMCFGCWRVELGMLREGLMAERVSA